MKAPYLIQRGTIVTPLAPAKNFKLSDAVTFDYMGSAEFEFGTLPKAFRKIRDSFDKTVSVTEQRLKDANGSSLRVFHLFPTEDEYEDYYVYIFKLYTSNGVIRTKEAPRFNPSLNYGNKIDFWWDIENQVIWSFNKNFMNRLKDYFQSSFKVMKD